MLGKGGVLLLSAMRVAKRTDWLMPVLSLEPPVPPELVLFVLGIATVDPRIMLSMAGLWTEEELKPELLPNVPLFELPSVPPVVELLKVVGWVRLADWRRCGVEVFDGGCRPPRGICPGAIPSLGVI